MTGRRRGRGPAAPERERRREPAAEEHHGPDWEPSGPEWAPPTVPEPAKAGDPPLEHPLGERSRHGGPLPED
jgi:hypothetical protein